MRNEMRWTVNWFQHQRDKWKRRSRATDRLGQSAGHRAYAEKQVHMWQQCMSKAEEAFDGVMVS